MLIYKTTLKKNLLKIEKEINNKEYISTSELKKLFDRYGVPLDIIKDVILKKNKVLIKE